MHKRHLLIQYLELLEHQGWSKILEPCNEVLNTLASSVCKLILSSHLARVYQGDSILRRFKVPFILDILWFASHHLFPRDHAHQLWGIFSRAWPFWFTLPPMPCTFLPGRQESHPKFNHIHAPISSYQTALGQWISLARRTWLRM